MPTQYFTMTDRRYRSFGQMTAAPPGQWVIRLALCSAFLFSGITKILNFQGAVIEVHTLLGLEPAGAFAALVIAVQLGGSALLLARGRLALAGALLLAGFTIVASLLAHAFWLKAAPAQVNDANTFFEHLGLVAGLVLAGWMAVGQEKS